MIIIVATLMSPACYVCCIYPCALQNIFNMETNTVTPQETAPTGAVCRSSEEQSELGSYRCL